VIFVFGYGSLVSAASAGRTLGGAPDPVPATLAGWRPAWIVGSDTSSHPDREFRDRHGRVYDGVVAVLGIEPGASCPGAVFAVGAHVLPALDRRERNYERRDVTGRVDWPGKPDSCRVFTYVPRTDALRRLLDAEEVVVRRSYLALLRAVPAPPFPLRELSQHVRLTRG
jgi:cation transport regulator ChaC